ncbi:caldesmon-like [Panicum virgatum]|uniref:caldesmon-like n=1 Tax=Panicum virgatum TaxID=38727 RepID=UPI0019D4F3E6|nr:caldesmon-like [Panicum virgatum]
MEATSSAEAAFQREWATLESERQRLSHWHTRLEAHTKAEASQAAETRSKLKADQEAYRANLRKVFDRELAVSSREKTLAQWEETFALEVVSFAAQRSNLETRLMAQRSELEARSQGLETCKQELDELFGTLAGWRKQLEEKASQLAVAELELEEDRKSLDRRESYASNMEKQLEKQRDSLKGLKESAEKRNAELEERSHEVEATKAALDTRNRSVMSGSKRMLRSPWEIDSVVLILSTTEIGPRSA